MGEQGRGVARRRSAHAFPCAAVVLLLAGCAIGPESTASRGQYSLKVADAALTSGAPDMALRVADLILAREPGNTAALVSRGDALYAMGQLTKARAAYRTAIELDPKGAAAYVGLGRTLVRSDPRAAEAAFATAVARDPRNVTALNNLGLTRDLLGQHGTAQEAYKTALTVDPEMADVKVNLGLSMALSGRAVEAADMMRPLVEHADATTLWRNNVAVALTMAGDRDGARLALDGIDGGRPALEMPVPPVPAPADMVAIHTAPLEPVLRQEIAGTLPRPVAPPVVAAIEAAGLPVAVQRAKAARAVTKPVDRASRPAITMAPTMPPAETRAYERLDWSVLRPGPELSPTPEPVVAREPQVSAPPRRVHVQFGALDARTRAEALWSRLTERMPDMLDSRTPDISRADVHGRTFWRLRTSGFVSHNEASAFCDQVRGRGEGCWAL